MKMPPHLHRGSGRSSHQDGGVDRINPGSKVSARVASAAPGARMSGKKQQQGCSHGSTSSNGSTNGNGTDTKKEAQPAVEKANLEAQDEKVRGNNH